MIRHLGNIEKTGQLLAPRSGNLALTLLWIPLSLVLKFLFDSVKRFQHP